MLSFTVDHNECGRLGLRHQQFFAQYKFKNVHWILNGKCIGYGDLRSSDLVRINEALVDGEKFEGFNEHHMSRMMQRENAVVVITSTMIEFPEAIPVTTETRREIWKEWGA